MDLTRSVLARPGAPVMRQWPPANSAMSSCSMTSFWPTMTLASSDWIWARLEVICSTVCFSVPVESVVISMLLAFQTLFHRFLSRPESSNQFVSIPGFSGLIRGQNSVRHRVKDDVDGERVGNFLREMLEVVVVVALPFPAVAIVGVVRGDHHHAALVVEDRAVMHHRRVRTFPGSVLGVEFALRSQKDVGHLALGLDVKHALVERMVQG